MKLSTELFKKAFDHFADGNPSHPVTERRAVTRQAVQCRVHLHPILGNSFGPAIEAWARDISPMGLGIICPKPIKATGQYFVSLPDEEPGAAEKSLPFHVSIQCSSEMLPGIHAIGLIFEESRAKRTPSSNHARVLEAADTERIRKAILG